MLCTSWLTLVVHVTWCTSWLALVVYVTWCTLWLALVVYVMWCTLWLALVVQDVDVHGEVQVVAHHLHVRPRHLVRAVDALGLPVRPVQLVLKQGQGEWVRQPWKWKHNTCIETTVMGTFFS